MFEQTKIQIQEYIQNTPTTNLIGLSVGSIIVLVICSRIAYKIREKFKLKWTISKTLKQININLNRLQKKIKKENSLSDSEKYKYECQIQDDFQTLKHITKQKNNYKKLRKLEKIQKRHKQIKSKLKEN